MNEQLYVSIARDKKLWDFADLWIKHNERHREDGLAIMGDDAINGKFWPMMRGLKTHANPVETIQSIEHRLEAHITNSYIWKFESWAFNFVFNAMMGSYETYTDRCKGVYRAVAIVREELARQLDYWQPRQSTSPVANLFNLWEYNALKRLSGSPFRRHENLTVFLSLFDDLWTAIAEETGLEDWEWDGEESYMLPENE